MYVSLGSAFGIEVVIGRRVGQGQHSSTGISISESLIQAWPIILVLMLATLLAFIASYIVFTRQEVR